MKIKSILLSMSLFITATSQASEKSYEEDRAAILAMAGKYKVDFNFRETFSLSRDYEIKEKKYHENAHELVVVVEDSENRIVLQHLLQFKQGDKDKVVKHWSQIWTYEDTEILEYQQGTEWVKNTLAEDQVAGTWSQLVTQTDESPRYESYAKWSHIGGVSQWVSKETARPLPRREYTKRSDYDVLVALNIHLVSSSGWVHEQSNRKLVKRDGIQKFLCQERGYNLYQKTDDHNFKAAEEYWKEHGKYWLAISRYWGAIDRKSDVLRIHKKYNGSSLRKATRKLLNKAVKEKRISDSEIESALDGFTAKN